MIALICIECGRPRMYDPGNGEDRPAECDREMAPGMPCAGRLRIAPELEAPQERFMSA